jgi:hypothetical protein
LQFIRTAFMTACYHIQGRAHHLSRLDTLERRFAVEGVRRRPIAGRLVDARRVRGRSSHPIRVECHIDSHARPRALWVDDNR